MKTEIPILLAMGYEVFTPKIIPENSGFRSGAVDFSFDKYLTLPPLVLEALNSADLYQKDWSETVVRYMNEYFGAAFIMPMMVPLINGLQRLEGAILLRAFGLESTKTYAGVLPYFHKDIFNWIYAIRDRFWFASGYQQLQEVEPKLLADRDVFLPIAMPATFEQHKNTWVGGQKQIIFVCPNIEVCDYYREIYEDFKRDFGDLPHVIIGAQKSPVDDPHVLGFVSDEEMMQLFQRSAVMYYHSREPRHVHYSPIEGAGVGIPVVLFADNLVARMIGHPIKGAVESVEQAREFLISILEGDDAVIDAVRTDQRVLNKLFSESYCLEVWKENFARSGILDYLEKPKSDVLMLSQGSSPIYERVPRALIAHPNAAIDKVRTLQDGIDFRNLVHPFFVENVEGLSVPESWGAWSEGESIEIEVAEPVNGMFEVDVTGGAYGENIGEPIEIQVGAARKRFEMTSSPWNPTTVTVRFLLTDPARTIRIHVPHPTWLPGSERAIGIGLQQIRVRPFIGTDSTLQDGIDFRNLVHPFFVENVEGLSVPDSWGAWSDGESIEIEVAEPVNGMFEVDITGGAYGENIGEPIEIQVGAARKRFEMTSSPWNPTTVTVRFFLTDPARTIRIHVPHPTRLPGSERAIGIGLQQIRVRPLVEPEQFGEPRAAELQSRNGVVKRPPAGQLQWQRVLHFLLDWLR
jgi:hypothetical protein